MGSSISFSWPAADGTKQEGQARKFLKSTNAHILTNASARKGKTSQVSEDVVGKAVLAGHRAAP